MNAPAVLEARGVGKSFPGVRALDEVSVQVRAGRVTAFVGENGAGKSTLMNIFSGVFEPDQGGLYMGGQAVRLQDPRDARRHGIATIFQELSVLPNLSVEENLLLGHEPRTRWGLLDRVALRSAARAMLARVGLEVDPGMDLGQLRVGQQQLVEIARALALDARVIIMDEPTSALSEPETANLLRIIAGLKAQGVAVIYITHKFEELTGLGDDLVVMRDGRLVATLPYEGLSRQQVIELMVGREVQLGRVRGEALPQPGPEVLRVRGATLLGPGGACLVDQVDFEVSRGEVLGVFGLMGAGRTELLETLFGVHGGRGSAQVAIEGCACRINRPADSIAAGIAFAPEDRKAAGLVLDMGSRQNASLGILRALARRGWVSAARERGEVAPLLERMNLRAASLDVATRTLSGGNQQKVVLAKWLATRPKVLFLDEPTRGIDVHAKGEIYRLVDDLARAGLAVLVVSSELPELLALADRIMVLRQGRKSAEFAWREATPENLMHAALPMSDLGEVH